MPTRWRTWSTTLQWPATSRRDATIPRTFDGDGQLHHAEDRVITVEVDGPGEPAYRTLGETAHHPFNGRALAVERPTGPGTVSVAVTSSGLAPRRATIEAR
jgi:beta-galactosidase